MRHHKLPVPPEMPRLEQLLSLEFTSHHSCVCCTHSLQQVQVDLMSYCQGFTSHKPNYLCHLVHLGLLRGVSHFGRVQHKNSRKNVTSLSL